MNKIIPPIIAKRLKDEAPKVIFIQKVKGPYKQKKKDTKWQQIYKQHDFTFILIQQPHKSPDLNILDLIFFKSIQSLMHKKMPKDVYKLLEAVNETFY